MTPPENKTAARLLAATLEVLNEAGWEGATTRAIAHRAGVNEVTLFRHFGTKQGVMVAAVARALAEFTETVEDPSGDLESRLIALATRYVAFVDAYPGLVARVLPAMRYDERAAALLGPFTQGLRDGLSTLFAQTAGVLRSEPPAETARAFVGPLLARPLLAHALPTNEFDAQRYVRLFLAGRERPAREGNT